MIVRSVSDALASVSPDVAWHEHRVSKQQRSGQKAQRPAVLWFTGLSGAGKSSVANALEQALFRLGHHSYLLDGDNVRHGLSRDLDRKSTRLNSSHVAISYAVFCLKK